MNASPQAINLIKKWEGFAPKAYLCPAGKLTIGYGHVLKTPRGKGEGELIGEREATTLLMADIAKVEAALIKYVRVPLTQNQMDALVSLVFNIGIAAFSRSTLLKLLNNGDYSGAAQQFTRWIYIDKTASNGLLRRREAERELFLC